MIKIYGINRNRDTLENILAGWKMIFFLIGKYNGLQVVLLGLEAPELCRGT